MGPRDEAGDGLKRQSVSHQDLKNFKYDSSHKGWRGPQKENVQQLRETVMMRKREKQLKEQKEIKLNHRKEKLLRGSCFSLSDNEPETDENSDVLSCESFDGSFTLVKPFDISEETAKSAAWNSPAKFCKKDDGFAWKRPSSSYGSLSFISTAQELERMSSTILEKDKEIAILRKQLHKTLMENGKLVEELSGFTGKKYNELAAENMLLKQQIQRLSHENVKLCGKLRLSLNTARKEIAFKEELERKNYAKIGVKLFPTKCNKFRYEAVPVSDIL